jgi:hypothetical protein
MTQINYTLYTMNNIFLILLVLWYKGYRIEDFDFLNNNTFARIMIIYIIIKGYMLL